MFLGFLARGMSVTQCLAQSGNADSDFYRRRMKNMSLRCNACPLVPSISSTKQHVDIYTVVSSMVLWNLVAGALALSMTVILSMGELGVRISLWRLSTVLSLHGRDVSYLWTRLSSQSCMIIANLCSSRAKRQGQKGEREKGRALAMPYMPRELMVSHLIPSHSERLR